MKTKTIQQPERYEAPGIKVTMLRKRAMLVASTNGENPEGNISDLDERIDG